MDGRKTRWTKKYRKQWSEHIKKARAKRRPAQYNVTYAETPQTLRDYAQTLLANATEVVLGMGTDGYTNITIK